LTLEDKDHLREAARSHNFANEKEEEAWRNALERLGQYCRDNYNECGERIDEIKDYIDDLIEEFHLKTLSDTEEIWRYDHMKGIYVPNAECIIKARIEKDYKDKVNNKFVTEQLGHIQRRSYIHRSDFNPNIEWIAAKSCMVNLKTGEIQPFDPKFMNTTQIPVEFNPNPILDFFCLVEGAVNSDNIHCPAIMKFLNEIMSPSDVEIVLGFLAYCLWRNYHFNVWMLLNGAGQNGKSTFLNLIERFLGSENVSGESLERLLMERFAPANLYQKMANVDADLSGDILSRHTGKLKKLTGNDEFPAEFKHKAPFKFRNYAKLIFSCNTIPERHDRCIL
jgi:putative DNA primase/helicase